MRTNKNEFVDPEIKDLENKDEEVDIEKESEKPI